MDWTTFTFFSIVLLSSSTLPGLCDKCPENCSEWEPSGKCKLCKWRYGGDRCEKNCEVGMWGLENCEKTCRCDGNNFEEGCDINSGNCRCKPGWSTTRCSKEEPDVNSETTATISMNPCEGDETDGQMDEGDGAVSETTDMTQNNNETSMGVVRPVPLSVIVASVIGVVVFMTVSTVCIICGIRRAHGKRSIFGNGTESSQKDLITSQTGRAEYSYVDVPDTFTTESAAQNMSGSNVQQVHEGTTPRRNRSVPGGRFLYDTVTDELILVDKSRKGRKKNHSMKVTVDQRLTNRENNNIHEMTNNRSRKRRSEEDYGHSGTCEGDTHDYNSFSELAKRQKAEISSDSVYSHLETARGENRDIYNTFEDKAGERPNERVSTMFEYAHLSSVFDGKAGSYSYIDVKPKWTADKEDVAGNYHHMAFNI
ncbi:platelet endothelial aggregation receptor 1-like isoform X2 [Pecten maximus]|uniref:platelet endothelial aggregation receptor 1-like isoform X2 n=1 Tax=Pecten maximus TaxID=6579 RepID=UPI0014588D54|nr:platelet endothelial aggregation receptor 1-like isoform X2 [Pecten maximus]